MKSPHLGQTTKTIKVTVRKDGKPLPQIYVFGVERTPGGWITSALTDQRGEVYITVDPAKLKTPVISIDVARGTEGAPAGEDLVADPEAVTGVITEFPSEIIFNMSQKGAVNWVSYAILGTVVAGIAWATSISK
jgi:hypothetical protein